METKEKLTDEELAEVRGGLIYNSAFADCPGKTKMNCMGCEHNKECTIVALKAILY